MECSWLDHHLLEQQFVSHDLTKGTVYFKSRSASDGRLVERKWLNDCRTRHGTMTHELGKRCGTPPLLKCHIIPTFVSENLPQVFF
jgi:hypothetical protein